MGVCVGVSVGVGVHVAVSVAVDVGVGVVVRHYKVVMTILVRQFILDVHCHV